MNFHRATVHDGAIELADGTRIPCDGVSRNGGSPVEVGVRPEDVAVDGDGAEATVVREIQRGHYKELVLTVGGDEVRAFVAPDAAASDRVRVRFTRAVLYADEPA
jgi:hypothetical protein